VRLVVYGSVHGSVRLSGSMAVRLIVYGSARSSVVRLCDSACVAVRQCAAVQQKLAVCGSKRVAVCGSTRQCVAVCGKASAWRIKCVAVRFTYIYIHNGAQNIHSLTGAVGMTSFFLAYQL
jgi:hypothetical protein